MTLPHFLSMIAPGLFKNGYDVTQKSNDTAKATDERESRPPSPEPAVIHDAYREALQARDKFVNEDWAQKGFEIGFKSGSQQTGEQKAASITQEFISKEIRIHDALEIKAIQAREDLLKAGQHGQNASLAKANLESTEIELKKIRDHINRDHANDRWSKCYHILLAFKNGYEDGHQAYLKSRGLGNY